MAETPFPFPPPPFLTPLPSRSLPFPFSLHSPPSPFPLPSSLPPPPAPTPSLPHSPVSLPLPLLPSSLPSYHQDPALDAVDLDIVLDTNQQDPDDTLTYSITAVDPTPPGLFTLNPITHQLQLAAGMFLDRETTATYAYTVTVVDSVGSADSGRIDITVCDVNDNAPTWDCDALEAAIATALADQFAHPMCGGITFYRHQGFSCNFRVHVPETAGIDCLLIGDVALLSYVSDRDEPTTPNSNIWLKVDHGDDEAIGLGLNPRSTTTPIDPENGKLYIHETLDYFKKPFHTLTLRALDRGDPPMTGNVFFNVTLEPCNRPPTCSSQNFTYCEETETRVGVVTAMDENDGALGALTYAITSGE